MSLGTGRRLPRDLETSQLLVKRQRRRSSFASLSEYADVMTNSQLLFQADINASGFVPDAPDVVTDSEDEEESSSVDEEEDEKPLAVEVYVVMFLLYSGGFLAALGSTIVVASLSVIGAEWEVSNEIGFVATSYMMAQTASQPLYGQCSDIFGRRGATLFSSAVFILGNFGCGMARTYPQLLAARAFAGIGGAGMGVMMSIVGSDLIPLRRRGIFQGYASIIWNLGSALGGPLGGFAADNLGWRWGFLIQLPLCLLHFSVAWLLVKNSFDVNFDETATDNWRKIKQVDFLGSITMILGIACGLLGLSLGGNQYAWTAPIIYRCLLASIFFLVLFALIEVYIVKKPLLAPELLFARTPGFITLTTFFSVMSQLAIIYTIPAWFSTIKGMSNTEAGAYLIPIVLSSSLGSLVAGIVMERTGKYKRMLEFVSVFNVLGPIMLSFWDRQSTPPILFWATTPFIGLGFGATMSVSTIALISSVDPSRMASAISSSFLFRSLGAVLGVALSNAIQQNTLQSGLVEVVTGPGAQEIIEELRKDLLFVWTLEPELREAVLEVFEEAGRNVFRGCAVIAGLAVVTSFIVKEYALSSRRN